MRLGRPGPHHTRREANITLGTSAFSLFDPELARLRDVLHAASARLERIKGQHAPGTFDYKVARLGFKRALAAMAFPVEGRHAMSWTIADERRVLAGLPPAQVRAVRSEEES